MIEANNAEIDTTRTAVASLRREFTAELASRVSRPGPAATPVSVAAHMIYENADPFVLRGPPGTLDTSQPINHALDQRRVRVEGPRFAPSPAVHDQARG